MKKIKLTQEQFWGSKFEGVAFDKELHTNNTFYKNVSGFGSGFSIDNSYSHSNGNFPFWANGEIIEFEIHGNMLRTCKK